MSQISINNLTFSYDTSYENIFENVSFHIDTDWKLGFIGRNGRGKTTFLNLLMGMYQYSGSIAASVSFDYFPFLVNDESKNTLTIVRDVIAPFDGWEEQMHLLSIGGTDEALESYGEVLELYTANDGFIIDELIEKEILKLTVSPDVLTRPFYTLSSGEKTKLLLAALFLKKNNFLLIDEPTNHLDTQGRAVVSEYLSSKKGYILVSHDRAFLDGCIDHVLSINRSSIEIQKGNYSSWQENKDRQDAYELSENERLRKDINRLSVAFENTADWSQRVEKSKKGTLVSGLKPDRGYIGHQAAKMMKRAKTIERRQTNAIDEKTQLLKNLEQADTLKLNILKYHTQRLVEAEGLSVCYGEKALFEGVGFVVNTGDRLALEGKNGSGKSSILKLLIGENIPYSGRLTVAGRLIISYVSQDTSFLKGSLKEFAISEQIDESLFKAILRKLDFTRTQFEKDMSEYSGGQKKKVLLAKSLSQPAHLYVWDEPLNFIDILSRVQIEELILKYCPTMIFVEHDGMFKKKISTKSIDLDKIME